jgi:hypothetical protein
MTRGGRPDDEAPLEALSGDPSDDLRRMVCFVAAALDVPYAYIAALTPPRSGGTALGLTVWLARDYGLQFEFAHVYGLAVAPCDYVTALPRIWPRAAGLASLLVDCAPGLPLRDSHGDLLGHLAALNPVPGARNADAVRLQALVRTIAAKLERWVTDSRP